MSETLTTPSQGRFEERFEHALNFLSNPYKLWAFGELAHKRTVLELAFADRLTYSRKTGLCRLLSNHPALAAPHIAQPFRVFDGLMGGNLKMVDEDGESLNTIFQTLADWESQLKPLASPSASEDSPTPRPPALTKGGQ